ncbi:MAG: hypothetical protein ACRDYB_09865, partial [Acidimicrobiales bacterium]
LDARWIALCRANLDHLLHGPARKGAEVCRGDARRLGRILAERCGQVDLVVTSPPYACDAGVIDRKAWLDGGRLCVAESLNYSANRANLGHARGPAYAAAMAEVYAACHAVLRPGGRLVVVTKNTRHAGRCFDLAALTVSLATAAGFSYLGHVVALHAAIRDAALVSRPSFWQIVQVRRARERGEPLHLVAHEDLTAYVRSTSSVSSGKLKGPQGDPKCSSGASPELDASVRHEPAGPGSQRPSGFSAGQASS